MSVRIPAALRTGSALLFSALALSACQDRLPSEPLPAAVSLAVKPVETEMPDGSTMQYQPVLLDQAGNRMTRLPTGTVLRWSVSDPFVATIDDTGLVRALNPGSVTVTAELVAVATGNVVPGAALTPTGTGNGVGNAGNNGVGKGLVGNASLNVTATAKSMEAVSGDGQTAVTGVILPDSLAVRLLDRQGLPVAGVPVTFAVTSGTGYVSPSDAVTDTNGVAWTRWSLGYMLGDQTVEARVNGVRNSPLIFHATAVADKPAAVVLVDGDSQTGVAGTSLGLPLQVRVADRYGNPVSGVDVGWNTSWGSVSPSSATSGADGLVSASWTLGTTLGRQSATASSAGLTGVTFAASAVESPVAEVRVTPDSVSVEPGRTTTLAATALDASGKVLAGASFRWSSTDASVASVSPDGRVSGVLPGTARIQATAAGKSGFATVVVPSTVAAITLAPTSANLTPGNTIQLVPTATDAAGQQVQGVTYTWASSDPAVAGVSTSGLVTANATGTASITVSAAGRSASATIVVSTTAAGPSVSRVVVSPPSATMNALGDTLQLAVSGYDAFGGLVQGARVKFTSTNPATAVVDSMGRVVAKAIGSTLIVATSICCQVADTAGVQIRQVVKTIQLSPASTSISVGGIRQFSATPVDSNGVAVEGSSVTWSSSAPSIATVSSTGVVSGVTAGTATITATLDGLSASGTVTVAAAPATGSAGDFVTYPSEAVGFIIGPQLKSGSSANPWPWFDKMAITQGEEKGTAFPADPTTMSYSLDQYINLNYYDQGLVQYINYYRTGDTQFLTYARKIADSWWKSPAIQQGTNTDFDNGYAPRNASLGGLMLRRHGRPPGDVAVDYRVRPLRVRHLGREANRLSGAVLRRPRWRIHAPLRRVAGRGAPRRRGSSGVP